MSQNLPMALFTSADGNIRLQLKLVDENLWLTQNQFAPWIKSKRFDIAPPTIDEHSKNLDDESELQPEATIRTFRIVAREDPN